MFPPRRNWKQEEKERKHKDAAKTLLSLHQKATKTNRGDLIHHTAAKNLLKWKQEETKLTKEKEQRKRKQAAQSLLSLSAEPEPKKWKSKLIQKHEKKQ